MDYALVGVGGLILSFLCRALVVVMHRSWFAQGFCGDSSVHFGIIKQLQKDRRARFIDQYLISPEPMSYPLGFHRFASLFPASALRKHSYLPNLCIFAGFSALFFVYVHYVEKILLHRADLRLLIISGIVFYLSVSNLVFYGPGIAYIKLSERLLGRTSCSFYFLGMFGGLYWHDTLSLFLALACGTLALVSSVFARQAIFFTSPLIALLSWNAMPVLLLGGSIVLAFGFSGEHFRRGLKHTLLQWKLYASHTKRSAFVRAAMSRFYNWRIFFDRSVSCGKKVRQSLDREPTRSAIFFPEFLLLMAFGGAFVKHGGDVYDLLVPMFATLCIYLVTSTNRFNHLGESYRYIEYNLYFFFPLLLSLNALELPLDMLTEGLCVYVVYGIFLASVHFLLLMRKQNGKFPERDQLQDFLSSVSLTKDAVVFPITMRLGADICARTECRSFWWQPGIISTGIYDEFIEEYPFLKRNWNGLFEKYGVTHVICDRSMLQALSWAYDFSGLQLICEDEYYQAYRVG